MFVRRDQTIRGNDHTATATVVGSHHDDGWGIALIDLRERFTEAIRNNDRDEDKEHEGGTKELWMPNNTPITHFAVASRLANHKSLSDSQLTG
jgi:hypothetical protein